LEDRLRTPFACWAKPSQASSADLPSVAVGGVVTTTRADSTCVAPEDLGRWIGIVMAEFPERPPEGVLRRFA